MDSLGHMTAPRHQKMSVCTDSPLGLKHSLPRDWECWALSSDWLWLSTRFPTARGWRPSPLPGALCCPRTACIQLLAVRGGYKKSGLWFNLTPLYRARPASELPMELAEAFAVTISLFKFLLLWLIPIPLLPSEFPTFKSKHRWCFLLSHYLQCDPEQGSTMVFWESQLALLWTFKNYNMVSHRHSKLRVVSFQRCKHVFHQCQGVKLQFTLPSPIADVPSALPFPTFSPSSSNSYLFTWYESLYANCFIEL